MKVSILSPVFNEALYIDSMIESVRSQSHQNWELLLVDDGSTDPTPDIVSRVAQQDGRIKLLSRGRKMGKVGAFNLAHSAAAGDLIVMLGGDDTLPRDAISVRVRTFANVPEDEPTVAFYKLRTFSEDKRYDGLVIPRGQGSSRSGGSITMNRALSKVAFPIPEHLVAEDIWLRHAATAAASRVIEAPQIVLNYRIHAANSNPRSQPFKPMTHAMHARHKAYPALLDANSLGIDDPTRKRLNNLWRAEIMRYEGRAIRLLMHKELPMVDRLAFASMSNAALWGLRSRFFKFFSGRRVG